MELILGASDLLPRHQKNPGMNNMRRKCPVRFLSIDKFKPEVVAAIEFSGRALYIARTTGGKKEERKYIYPKGKEPSSSVL